MEESDTKVTISGSVQYERTVTALQAAQVIALIESGSTLSSPGERITQRVPIEQDSEAGAPENPRDWIDESGAQTNSEKITALAGYWQETNSISVKIEDLKKLFVQVREQVPGNLHRDVTAAVKAGWVMEDPTGGYRLSRRGEDVLLKGFRGGATSPRRSNSKATNGGGQRKSSGQRKKLEVPAAFAGFETLPSTIEGMPSYQNMKKNYDKLLWALLLAKEQGIGGLSNQEVVWLTDYLGEAIPSNQVSATFDSANKKGYVNRAMSDNSIRITSAGEKYLGAMENSL